MPRCSPRRVGIPRRRCNACSARWRHSGELPPSLLGRAAIDGEAIRPGQRDRPRGSRPREDSAGPPRHPEPVRARRGAAFHAALADELWNRYRLLSTRIVHDEIQSEIHGGTRGPPDRHPDPSGSGRVDGPGGAPRPVRAAGSPRADRGDGRSHVTARGGGTRRVHRPSPRAGIPPGARGGTACGDHPRPRTRPAPRAGVKKPLEPFLPVPVIGLNGRGYNLNYDRPKSIGKVRAWYGNFALLVRAYAYILRMGGDGLKEVSDRAVLNANYIRHRLAGVLDVPFGGLRKHEFVASAAKLAAERGVRTVDLAKRLMDFGYHPPTVYFPHLVEEALMVEPTETETKETLDGFVEALKKIVKEDPDTLHSAPHNTAVARVDEVQAAREPILSWRTLKSSKPPS